MTKLPISRQLLPLFDAWAVKTFPAAIKLPHCRNFLLAPRTPVAKSNEDMEILMRARVIAQTRDEMVERLNRSALVLGVVISVLLLIRGISGL